MSGLFKSTIIKGNRLTDFAQTTATVGSTIPWGFGDITSTGNCIWAALPPTEHMHRKRQGKGGTKTEEYTYTLDYAVAFVKGKVYRWNWIKRGGKVVYTTDPNAPVEDREYSQKWLERSTIYDGTRDQAPDSTIEAREGVGRVSAFKDLGYIVLEQDDVTDNGGAVPNYEACVTVSPPEAYLTSKLFPSITNEFLVTGFDCSGVLRSVVQEASHEQELASSQISFAEATLRAPLQNTETEESSTTSIFFEEANLRSPLKNARAEDESAQTGLAFGNGLIRPALISTETEEGANTSISFPGASLYVP